jgi:hypothetical protein
MHGSVTLQKQYVWATISSVRNVIVLLKVSERNYVAGVKIGRKKMSFTEIGRQKTVWEVDARNVHISLLKRGFDK